MPTVTFFCPCCCTSQKQCYQQWTAIWYCSGQYWAGPTAGEKICFPISAPPLPGWNKTADNGDTCEYEIYVQIDKCCTVDGDCSSQPDTSTPSLPGATPDDCCNHCYYHWSAVYDCGNDSDSDNIDPAHWIITPVGWECLPDTTVAGTWVESADPCTYDYYYEGTPCPGGSGDCPGDPPVIDPGEPPYDPPTNCCFPCDGCPDSCKKLLLTFNASPCAGCLEGSFKWTDTSGLSVPVCLTNGGSCGYSAFITGAAELTQYNLDGCIDPGPITYNVLAIIVHHNPAGGWIATIDIGPPPEAGGGITLFQGGCTILHDDCKTECTAVQDGSVTEGCGPGSANFLDPGSTVTITPCGCDTLKDKIVANSSPISADPYDQSKWPLMIRVIVETAKPGDAGVGDTAQRIAAKLGGEIFKKLVPGCGCDDRQKWLNERYPYKN